MKKHLIRIIGVMLCVCMLFPAASVGAFAGVTDVSGGSGVTVKTTVRNNYTVMGELTVIETGESEFYKTDGDNIFTDDETGAEAYGKKIMEWLVSRGASWSEITTTKTKTGSKLTYTGTDYNGGDIVIGDPDDVFSGGQGQVCINEIRDDYYLLFYSAKVHKTEDIAAVDVSGVKLDFAGGDTVVFSGKAGSGDYVISYECWERMEKTQNGLEPVAFAYSDESKYTAATPVFDKFEADASYIYSVTVKAENGRKFTKDTVFTLNGEKPKYGTYTLNADGTEMYAIAVFTLNTKKADGGILKGDVNGDGKVTASDARLALRISARLESADSRMISAGDINGDGKITAAEARRILRFSAKLEKEL